MPRDPDDTAPQPGAPRPKRRRRTRYTGTHPRRFEDKYKELDPERYPETVERVLAAGRTPAGSHRPICVAEVLEVLSPRPGGIAVDVTLGGGGHALALLPRLLPGGRLIGLDVDAVELERTRGLLLTKGFGPECFLAVKANMAALKDVLTAQGLAGADAIVADLGCSSMQLDDPARGFSYKQDGPLDLRLDPQAGEPASARLARIDEASLAALLRANADEPNAARLAAAITEARVAAPIQRTAQLACIVRAALPRSPDTTATLARVFQALRIEVNDEFGGLETFLAALPACLLPGGCVAVLTFHSGEDRRVKAAFKDGLREGHYAEVARGVIRPSRAEVGANPRASSAKLRWARRPATLDPVT